MNRSHIPQTLISGGPEDDVCVIGVGLVAEIETLLILLRLLLL